MEISWNFVSPEKWEPCIQKLTAVFLLQIKPFRQAHLNRDTDKELLKLSKYLKDIADLDDFTQLNHKKWERFVKFLI